MVGKLDSADTSAHVDNTTPHTHIQSLAFPPPLPPGTSASSRSKTTSTLSLLTLNTTPSTPLSFSALFSTLRALAPGCSATPTISPTRTPCSGITPGTPFAPATTAASSPSSSTVLPPSPVRVETTHRFSTASPARASADGVYEARSADVSESSACCSASRSASCVVANAGIEGTWGGGGCILCVSVC
jgi:hypothetical protein